MAASWGSGPKALRLRRLLGRRCLSRCGEDSDGLNFLSVDLDIDCEAGSQLTSGDLSNAADPTYYYARFTCIVPPDQAPGSYSMRTQIDSVNGNWGISVYAYVTEPTTPATSTTTTTTAAPTTTTTTIPNWPSASLISLSPSSGPVGSQVTIRYNVSDPDGVDVTYIYFSRVDVTSWPSPALSSLVEGSSTDGTYTMTVTVPERPAGPYTVRAYNEDSLGWSQGITIGEFTIVD